MEFKEAKNILNENGYELLDEVFGFSLADKAKAYLKYCNKRWGWGEGKEPKILETQANPAAEIYYGIKKWLENKYPEDEIMVKCLHDWTNTKIGAAYTNKEILSKYQKVIEESKCGLKAVMIEATAAYVLLKKA